MRTQFDLIACAVLIDPHTVLIELDGIADSVGCTQKALLIACVSAETVGNADGHIIFCGRKKDGQGGNAEKLIQEVQIHL